ncbi:MAG TPA: cytochrome c maturation protein CcmE [Oligoflexia bacterium]|nr:cytochrome c maturation protein CcmE [Oligoflexia bacterium]HMP48829.1 cytochrome c maturation protein CcmE [Oligoflexia bacterium]
MNKLILPILLVSLILAYLINSAVNESAKKVLTVLDLLEEDGSAKSNLTLRRIRLGARVASDQIKNETKPKRKVSFPVHDINKPEAGSIPVEYEGNMPDTLREGRDVILEGDFINGIFNANVLNTQCPSKYEPPDPTESNTTTKG